MNETEAERYLLSLELFGMHFGLERMRRLMTALGHPERQFESIHVVGTNGKSSTVRMIAAILAHHGVATGAYLSPHLLSFGERIRIGDRDLEPAAFAAAVTRAARAAELVDRVGGGEDPVTQFEALTAAAYSELARREVEVAVIEAGLGGRYDATNVIPSKVQVLTSVGLEHTRWLGPTLTDIAGEKLAVVQDGATLVLGPDLDPAVERVAAAVAAEHRARVVHAGVDPGVEVAAPGTYQRRNFALARAAAEAFLGRLDERTVAAAGADVRVPGTAAGGGGQAADAARRCAQPGRHAGARRSRCAAAGAPADRVVAVVSILDDKDAAGMLSVLLPACDAVVFTASQNPRALPPPTLLSLATQLGGRSSEIVPDPVRALARGRELAGPEGVVIAAGSLYLIADLLSPSRGERASTL